jgi:hypothetical protein
MGLPWPFTKVSAGQQKNRGLAAVFNIINKDMPYRGEHVSMPCGVPAMRHVSFFVRVCGLRYL